MTDKNDKIKIAQLEKDDFIYMIAHELNAPLRHIKSFLDILFIDFDGELSPEQQDYKKIILNAANDAQEMIAGLLEFSRFNPECAFQSLDLEDLISKILADISRDIFIENSLETKPLINGDAHILRVGLTHIIDNAFTHNPDNQSLRVHVGLQSGEAGQIKLTIDDNGRGVPQKSLDKLTCPFFAIEDGHRGLGLAFAQKAITAHNGTLSFMINDQGGLKVQILF